MAPESITLSNRNQPNAEPLAFGSILIIDDEPAVRDFIADILEFAGYTCHTEPNGDQVLAVLEKESIDLVITDINLDICGRSGMELIEVIRSHDETIPIIVITGCPSINRAVDAIKRGAYDFLVKPFERDVLLAQVARALKERQLRTENERLRSEVDKAAVIERLNRQLQDRLGELTRLYEISDTFHQLMDGDDVFDAIARLASKVTGARRGSVMVLDGDGNNLRVRATAGFDGKNHPTYPRDEGISGQVLANLQPIRATQPLTPLDMRLHRLPEESEVHSAWLVVPLIVAGEVLGTVNLTDKTGGEVFTDQDEHLIRTLTEKAGIKLENQALYEGIYSNLVDTLNALITTIEAKDPYTHDHSHRVTEYAVALARLLGMGEEELEMLNFAGRLHDIGKIGVRDEILIKSDRLTDEEFAVIRRHPEIGDRIVAPLGLAETERAIIRHHHERWDGKGYPDQLAGEAIPFLARVVGVADAFDAMTSTRSYRKAMTLDTVLTEMERCSGQQFDPHIVRVWVDAVRAGTIDLRSVNTEFPTRVIL